MKKLLKIVAVLCVLAALLLVGGVLVLKQMYPPQKIKQLVQSYAQEKLNRQVRFEQVSFNWIGLTLTEFALSEENSFEQGTFVSADQLVAKIAVKPLLKKQVEITTLQLDGLDVQIIARKDGTFNFSSLSQTSKEEPADEKTATPAETKEPFVLRAEQITATACNLTYQNEADQSTMAVRDLNLALQNFDLKNPFTARVDFTAHLSQANQQPMDVPLSLEMETALADFDLEKAYLDITSFTAAYQTARLQLNGKLENFKNPTVRLDGQLSGADYTLLKPFLPDINPFTVPPLKAHAELTADLDNSAAQIADFSLETADSFLRTSGTVAWGDKTSYNVQAKTKINLAQAVLMAGSGSEFNPQGTVSADLRATDKNNFLDVRGTVSFQKASLVYDPFTLTNLNGTVTLAGLDNISAKNLSGQLNGGDFTSSFAYKNARNVTDVALDLNLSRFTLARFPSGEENSSAEKNTAAASTQNKAEDLMNLTARVTVGAIEVPYFRSDGLTLQADLQNISESMKKSNGTLSFELQQGAITDLEPLLKQNKLVNIILLPLTIVQKVSGALKLGLFQKDSFEIALAKGIGHYTFTNGVMNVDQTQFDTTLSNISAAGNINFPADTVALKATATLLTDAAPMVIKIGGTPSNPTGKLDVVNTLTSVVGGFLSGKSEKSVAEGSADTAKTAVKDTVTDTAEALKKLGGLFKKK